jgi:MerR family transcriptional regulator, thiopeptide resistance regulator
MATFERVIPLLTYQDISAAHDFLVHAFGFASGGVHRTPDGQAVHGEVRAGDVAIWLHRVTAEHDHDSPRGVDGPIPVRSFRGAHAPNTRAVSGASAVTTRSPADLPRATR